MSQRPTRPLGGQRPIGDGAPPRAAASRIGCTVQELAARLGAPFPDLVHAGAVRGAAELTRDGESLRPRFTLSVYCPEQLARRGVRGKVRHAFGEALFTQAYLWAEAQARQRGLTLRRTWAVRGLEGAAVVPRVGKRWDAEAAAERVQARAAAEQRKAVTPPPAPPPPTPEEAERALVAEITALVRRPSTNLDETTNLAARTAPPHP